MMKLLAWLIMGLVSWEAFSGWRAKRLLRKAHAAHLRTHPNPTP